MLLRLPSFVLQTSYSDKTKKNGAKCSFSYDPDWHARMDSRGAGISNWAILWFDWGEHALTDRWSEDLTDSWHHLSHQPCSAHFLLIIRQLESNRQLKIELKGFRWRSTLRMSARNIECLFQPRGCIFVKNEQLLIPMLALSSLVTLHKLLITDDTYYSFYIFPLFVIQIQPLLSSPTSC